MSLIYNFGNTIDMYKALDKNKGYFDFGFTTTFIGVNPHILENYLFIGESYWNVDRYKNNEKVYCIKDTESRENNNFNEKLDLALSYFSDHLIEYSNTPTNHILLCNVTNFISFLCFKFSTFSQ